MLIEAVGITGTTLKPTKNSHAISFRPEVPIGKACSSLTTPEIIKHLTGDFKLTKKREVLRCFAEGKILFEEYIFKLEDIVGVRMLIEAVGITGTTLKPTKNSHAISFRPEVPIGKACSSLTTPEIIKYLRGDFKLSKKRSNDLFWEAVWPRLLARGWHSEQRNLSLVFLVPGIEKFSRRLVREAEQSKVRKLRSLPVQTESISTPSNPFTETEQDIYEESKDDAEEKTTSNPAEYIIDRTTFLDSSDCVTSIHESQCLNLLNDMSPRKATNYNCIPTLKSDDLRYLAPETKQKHLTDCNDGDSSCGDENVEAASEKSQSWICIDLNLPYVLTDADTDKPLIKDTMQNNDNASANGSAFDSFLSKTSEQPQPPKLPELLTKDTMPNNDKLSNDDSSVKKTSSLSDTSKQPLIKSQRQSTRNRPLTTKVREALEHDLFRTRRKRKDVTLQNKSTTPRSQRARGSSIVGAAFDDSVVANPADTRKEDEHSDRGL
ncbi:hypothetical protein C1H46_019366 [Malus baccata]|uniref:DUF7650 domain-containing protein n=1 Tax=Malus baccata TaxID=106549 RepID=A0A540M8F5_MALBA|nr:hypothetical protein C1H46_019366 [Malus baccata]